jgi:acetyl-CoA synthetase
MPGYKVVLLLNDEGVPASEGEVCLALDTRPIGLMLGYDDDPERNAEATRTGYYRTGDIAAWDEEGYLTYIGRQDDVFKASDFRISPFELESLLLEHVAIAEAAVVPSPDTTRLAAPKAFINLRPGYEPCQDVACAIFEFSRKNIAPYKRIKRIEFVELPKTISGKIRRVDLRRKEELREFPIRELNEYWEEDFPDLA